MQDIGSCSGWLWRLILLVAAWGACTSLQGRTQDEEEARSLRAWGYVDFPSESARARKKGAAGLTHSRPSLTSPGYTLITAIPEARALVVDMAGDEVHRWQNRRDKVWVRAELSKTGDLLVIGRREVRGGDGRPIEEGFIARYGWDGTEHWRQNNTAHHDLDQLPGGDILTLGLGERRLGKLRFEDNDLLFLSADGELRRRLSLYDLLASRPDILSLAEILAKHPDARSSQGPAFDLLHANAVQQMPFPDLEGRGKVYGRSNILVTVRQQDLVAVVDPQQQRLVWAWGPGEIQFPHEATWLENGNILLFDNGSAYREHSRIVEVDPLTDEIVWTWRHLRPKRFYSSGRGTVQALPAGNVLVASSNQGEIFEVTRTGRIVWRYLSRGTNGRLLTVRAERYPTAWVEPFLAGGR